MKFPFLASHFSSIFLQFRAVWNFFVRSAKELYGRYSDCAPEEKISKWLNNVKGVNSLAVWQFDMLRGN
ncbi:hypothetical protein KY385_00080 [Candidatus Parcubacteria bacterium]|nr:hypothetical protein [Candidatus Parcubacteria bacterium]